MEICFSFVKWSAACRKALLNSELLIRKEQISDVNFIFNKTSSGGLSWSIVIDGRKQYLGDIEVDSNKSLSRIKEWIERILVKDRLTGQHNPEICNVECTCDSYSLIFVHYAWARSKNGIKVPVSSFIVLNKRRKEPVINSLCLCYQTLGRLYSSLLTAIDKRSCKYLKSPNIETAVMRFL